MRILLIGTGETGGGQLARALGGQPGLEVVYRANGAAALEMAGAQPFDAVVTDLEPGGLAGLELIRRLRLRWPRIPLVVLTSDATIGRAVECMRAGASDFLPGPVTPSALLSLLGRAAGEPRWRVGAPGPGRNGNQGGNGSNGAGHHPAVAGNGGGVVVASPTPPAAAEPPEIVLPRGLTLAEVERRYLLAALEESQGDYARLAAQLGISRKTLWEKRRRLARESGWQGRPSASPPSA